MPKHENKIDTLLTAVLICAMLKQTSGLSETNIIEILTDDDIVGLLTIYDALSIIEKKSLATLNDGIFKISEAGESLFNEFSAKIPPKILENCILKAKNANQLSLLKKSVNWEIEKLKKGYNFNLNYINEMGGGDILSLKIYSPSYESAVKMQENFLKNPVDVFERIMFIFMRDYD
ncbi:MAG: DUF4364 family protein [Oscillospiraceae bacterium]|nr:DUF4364 family protein [Oscillospiraceae bacterium]